MAATIQSVKARQIFDSRGNPTVEVRICVSDPPAPLPLDTVATARCLPRSDGFGFFDCAADLARQLRAARAGVPAEHNAWFLPLPPRVSRGVYEALELRDGGSDYLGRGVSKAVSNVNSIIAPALIGKDPTAQTELDNFMVQQLPLLTLAAASSSFPPSYSIPLWRRL
ncbi:hypothetical protein ZWY2020_057304 [Hordeum vulgare]|nr:hypothetical protein ZWY2020_057304 [Hordeum vulgare]